MYNLLITAQAGQWDETPYEYGISRVVREYTDDPLKARFLPFTQAIADELKSFPALFAYERGNDAPARVGWINRVRIRDGEVRVEYTFEPSLAPIPHSKIQEMLWDLEITNSEICRTHWAVKDVDLLAILDQAGAIDINAIRGQSADSRIVQAWLHPQPSANIEARPSIFRVPSTPPDPRLVSVMMSFAPGMTDVYHAIQTAVERCSATCLRADDIWEETEVIQDVFALIYRSRIVICDFSERNPNVLYEAGIAHTLGRTVVPIVQNKRDIPFDLQHHRYIEYLDNNEGRHILTERLVPRLMTLLSRQP